MNIGRLCRPTTSTLGLIGKLRPMTGVVAAKAREYVPDMKSLPLASCMARRASGAGFGCRRDSNEGRPMTHLNRQAHWEGVYSSKGEKEVSWFQETPGPSLALLELVGAAPDSAIIDIGGGASRLVDALVEKGFMDLTVLDLSGAALASAKQRIGAKSDKVSWISADITVWTPTRTFDVWHDRAAFHFLTEPADQAAYIARLRGALRQGGFAIIGTFAPDGPEKCSGLHVCRYDSASLQVVLGPSFALIDSRRHDHTTPWGALQKFEFSTFQRLS